MNGKEAPAWIDIGALTLFLAVFSTNIVIRFIFDNVVGEISYRLLQFTKR
jgi:hypothetical protein